MQINRLQKQWEIVFSATPIIFYFSTSWKLFIALFLFYSYNIIEKHTGLILYPSNNFKRSNYSSNGISTCPDYLKHYVYPQRYKHFTRKAPILNQHKAGNCKVLWPQTTKLTGSSLRHLGSPYILGPAGLK